MYIFTVKSMSCGGCANAITRSIQAVDKVAMVKIQLPLKRVEVETSLPHDELLKLFDDAGYPAELV